ncbi:putative RNA-directed DNA polymerase, eukaryota, reverse transcriptase zinc-binding domain protein [Tanacetum coccineum]
MFRMKDVGPFHYYLGMTQRKYALELLECANVLDSKPTAEPMDPILKLSSRDGYLLRDPSTYLQNISICDPYTLPTCGGDEDTTNVAMPNTPATPVSGVDPSNNALRDEEGAYVPAFIEAKIDEERFLRQKAKIQWLEVGDSNSSYFHTSIKSRNQRSRIDVVTTSDNGEATGVSDDSNTNMVRHVTNDEIKRAMFDISDDKAPGPDGYTSTFFKKGRFLFAMFIYKCISKILTNRIIEGIKEAELMHNYHRNRGPPICAFKVDIGKAYDTVDWRFLGFILKGFDDLFIFARDIQPKAEMSWGWRKILQLREHVKGFFSFQLGNGLKASACAWEAIRPRGNEVLWHHTVCFSHCIPRHAFHIWLVMRRSLKTPDTLRHWDVDASTDLSLLRCSLCDAQQDSHEHQFFECALSSQVWCYIRGLAGMEHDSPILEDIMLWLQPMASKRTDIAKITEKRSKSDKHEHGNG